MTASIAMPDNPAARAITAAEHGMILWLLQRGGLTFEGMAAAYWRITARDEVLNATGPLCTHRETLEAALIAAMSAATGMPAEYWTARPLIAEDDDAAVVGNLTVEVDDDGNIVPGSARLTDTDTDPA